MLDMSQISFHTRKARSAAITKTTVTETLLPKFALKDSEASGKGHEIKVVPWWRLHHPQVALQQARPSAAHLTAHGQVKDDLRNDDARSDVEDPQMTAEEAEGGISGKNEGAANAKGDQQHGSQNAIHLEPISRMCLHVRVKHNNYNQQSRIIQKKSIPTILTQQLNHPKMVTFILASSGIISPFCFPAFLMKLSRISGGNAPSLQEGCMTSSCGRATVGCGKLEGPAGAPKA